MRDLVRVTRPGGWVELVESGSDIEPSGPATTRLFELAAQLAASYELDRSGSVSSVLDDHLRAAGAEAVEKRSVPIPIGDWGGRVGSLMASELRSTFMGLCATFESRFGLPAALCQELLHAMRAAPDGYHVFNLGTDEYVTVNDSVGVITRYLGVKPDLSYTGGERGWIGDSPFIFLDTRRILGTGWKPKVTIRQAVERTVAYLAKQLAVVVS